ncbi:GGDEF domain-containing protein [Piscinibacter aquaticus]|uniref:GGDEF domain-containing protein n=1 Tax=Piscinibacter aquaticus TaxID=392597 RepID=A0A5C6U534_9BURK|nr:GGDEF domain-containing protein [Piscinibacter aquaticus]
MLHAVLERQRRLPAARPRLQDRRVPLHLPRGVRGRRARALRTAERRDGRAAPNRAAHRVSRLPRSADRVAQPGPGARPRRAVHRRGEPRRPDGGPGLPRSRPLQERQRLARPRRGRSAAAIRGAAAARLPARDRHHLAPGGDEFLVVIGDLADAAAVKPVLDKLMAALEQPVLVDGQEISTSASIGLAQYPDDGADFDTLLQKADTALYRARTAVATPTASSTSA